MCGLCQVIEVPGYTLEEKVKIALRHLLPRQLGHHGMEEETLKIPENTLYEIGALAENA